MSQTGQERTDRQDRQRSDSIGRTVLQTIAQKLKTLCFPSFFLKFAMILPIFHDFTTAIVYSNSHEIFKNAGPTHDRLKAVITSDREDM